MARKRKIVHHYDPVNDYRWADLFSIGEHDVKVTRYRASIMSGKKGYRARSHSPIYLGKQFIKDLNSVLKGKW